MQYRKIRCMHDTKQMPIMEIVFDLVENRMTNNLFYDSSWVKKIF